MAIVYVQLYVFLLDVFGFVTTAMIVIPTSMVLSLVLPQFLFSCRLMFKTESVSLIL
jgi:hypothetical protein